MNNNQRTLAFIWYLMVIGLTIISMGVQGNDFYKNGISFKNLFFGAVSIWICFVYIEKLENLFNGK